MYIYHNCSSSCQEEQEIFQDGNSCYHFPVFLTENVPHKLILFNCVVNTLLMLTTIIGNILVLSAIWKTSSLRTPSIILLCGLATTDLVVGLVVQPLFLSMELTLHHSNSMEFPCSLAKAYISLSYLACSASLLTITAISLDRLLAIQYHLRYASVVTVPRVIFVIVLNWLLSGLVASLILRKDNKPFLVVLAAGVAICLCLSTCAHVKVCVVVRRHQQQIQTQAEAVQAWNGLNMARFKKAAVNAFLVHYFLLLCYTPLFINFLLSANKHRIPSALSNKTSSAIVWKLTSTIVFFNSSVNPFIYCWRLQEVRVAVKNVLNEIFCRT